LRFDDRDVDWLADLLDEAAQREIMPRFRRLGSGEVRRKTSAIDLVTDADVEAERFLTARLSLRYPGALVIGEEACAEDPRLLDGLAKADLAFVLDPVDGTYNFASGVPLFGVILAVVARGETVAGLIHDPLGRDCMIAVRGGGSRLRHEGGRETAVRVAAAAPLTEMTGSASWQYFAEPDRSRLARNQAKALSQIAYRCSAHEYRLIASGHAHFVVYNKLMPWDHLAGTLIQIEAGGHVARLDGSAYLPEHLDGGLLVAPDRESWAELRRELWAD
jgi:fructose-1,6-bisphosphatase/inositol monophosphatase family enzyme